MAPQYPRRQKKCAVQRRRATPKTGKIEADPRSKTGLKGSDDAEGHHGVCDFFEPGDIGAADVVAITAFLDSGFMTP